MVFFQMWTNSCESVWQDQPFLHCNLAALWESVEWNIKLLLGINYPHVSPCLCRCFSAYTFMYLLWAEPKANVFENTKYWVCPQGKDCEKPQSEQKFQVAYGHWSAADIPRLCEFALHEFSLRGQCAVKHLGLLGFFFMCVCLSVFQKCLQNYTNASIREDALENQTMC